MDEDVTTSTDIDDVQADENLQLDTQDTQATQGDDTQVTDESDDSEEVLEWAKKKNLSLDDPVKLAKMIRESETKMHEATKKESELRNVVQTTSQEDGDDDVKQLVNRLTVTDFFLNNPEARELDAEMAKIVTEKPYLANDLQTVLDLAKFRSETVRVNSEREAGRKEALKQVAKAETASRPKTSATTRESKGEITDDDIGKMSASEYESWKKETGFNPFS